LELRTSVVWFILFQSASSPGFDTIFQIQEPLGPVPKHGPVSGTHCTLSKVRNCIGIKFYNQLKLRFVIYQVFYLQNSTFLLTFQKKSSILLEKLAMFWRIFIHESRFSFDYCKRPISQSDPSLTFHLERSQFRSGPYELESFNFNTSKPKNMPTLVTTRVLFCGEFLSIGDKNKRGL